MKVSFVLLCSLFTFSVSFPMTAQEQSSGMTPDHEQWLKNKFSAQHQEIIPKVAVADMFYGCNLARKTEPTNMPFDMLINKVSKPELAEKLDRCLDQDKLNSEQALNFGLIGCYTDIMYALPEQDRKEKMVLVKRAINKLSRAERQKSFTKCVTEQAIKYLK